MAGLLASSPRETFPVMGQIGRRNKKNRKVFKSVSKIEHFMALKINFRIWRSSTEKDGCSAFARRGKLKSTVLPVFCNTPFAGYSKKCIVSSEDDRSSLLHDGEIRHSGKSGFRWSRGLLFFGITPVCISPLYSSGSLVNE